MNFYAKSGKQEAVQAAEQQQRIDDRNVGHKLLSKMGWRVCSSISGINHAIKQVTVVQRLRCVRDCNRKAKVSEPVVLAFLRLSVRWVRQPGRTWGWAQRTAATPPRPQTILSCSARGCS